MPNRPRGAYDERAFARRQLADIGRELRLARILSGMRQVDVARAIEASVAQVSRIESGKAPSVIYRQVARFAEAVGLRLWTRAYPTGRRLLDAPQLALIGRLQDRLHESWEMRTEVPMPIAGDLRAADVVLAKPGCTVMVEAIARLADYQAQSRSALAKKRDLGADRLVLLVADTRANRGAWAEASGVAATTFPIAGRAIERALRAGSDPGGDGVVFL